MKNCFVFIVIFLLSACSGKESSSRNYIEVVGSSTVFPFSTAVAERFGKGTEYRTPKVESTGSGGGIKLFCKGVGIMYPDITNSSRRMKKSEFKTCQENGVQDIVEVLIGFDGIVIANSKKAQRIDLSLSDVYLALAKYVPDLKTGKQEFIPNPYKTWKQVNPELPDIRIEVLGPPPTSGTRDAFVELALEGGCQQFPWIKALKKTDKNKFKVRCHTMREDGAFIEAGENDNLIVSKLESNPKAFGVFGFSFLEQNADKVKSSLIEGYEPSFDTIAQGNYKISRPLYFYVKKAHAGIVPGIEAFLAEFTRESTWGNEGYLTDKGMIPLRPELRAKIKSSVMELKPLSL